MCESGKALISSSFLFVLKKKVVKAQTQQFFIRNLVLFKGEVLFKGKEHIKFLISLARPHTKSEFRTIYVCELIFRFLTRTFGVCELRTILKL